MGILGTREQHARAAVTIRKTIDPVELSGAAAARQRMRRIVAAA
jgi:hypothetical protein